MIMFEYKRISNNELEQVIRNASQKNGVNEVILEKVVRFKQKFYPRKWAKYEEANPKTIRLMPDEYRLAEIKEDYKNMREMFFGDYPSFEEMMSKIVELEREIHKITGGYYHEQCT